MTTLKQITGWVFMVLLVASCATRKVTRVDPAERIDLSGRWNDVDSRQVAEQMMHDALSKPWLERFTGRQERPPVVIVGVVINRSHEHIEAETFIKDIEREFVNSGRVRVVENDFFREKLREERAQQQINASLDTQKRLARELGADFMLLGTINSTVDQYRKEKVVNYKINLELVNLESTEKVWIGDKEIKKYIKN